MIYRRLSKRNAVAMKEIMKEMHSGYNAYKTEDDETEQSFG